MKTLLAAVVAFSIFGAGCIVHVPGARSSSASSAQRCPPGHQWSDGRCHDRGRGHDRR